MKGIPAIRVRRVSDLPADPGGEYVLYWMTAARRGRWNFGLQRAVELAEKAGRPLVILEALRCDYPWACDRFHSFILNGMEDNREHFEGRPVLYYPWAERERGEGKGLLQALASRAVAVVTDDFPAFFLPRMLRAAAFKVPVRLEAVDSNGLFPMNATDRTFTAAHSFRRHLQKTLPAHLEHFPERDPLETASLPRLESLPDEVAARWPAASAPLLAADPEALKTLPLDHSVGAVETRGGADAAEEVLRRFLAGKLHVYPEARSHPDDDAGSGLSPYLHFGHISSHQVFSELAECEEWTPGRLSGEVTGSREGWWGMSEGAEAFLDQLITWREIGFNMCCKREDYDRLESLPDWALHDLTSRVRDRREYVYSLPEFESASTHDPLWNAAQTQLLWEGRIHNTLRMLWGKKILEWTASPQDALAVMIELNNKYALDGRDPNSTSGTFWVLGRYDRPWGPIRKIYGRVRYMSSANTLRKVRAREYLEKYSL